MIIETSNRYGMKKNGCSLKNFMLAIAIFNITNCLFHIYKHKLSAHDFIWVWKECACALKGIDVFDAISKQMYIDGIGYMPVASATVPWARIIGNIIHPGFFSMNWAIVYGYVVYALIVVLAWWSVSKKLSAYHVIGKRYAYFLTGLFFLMPFYWVDGLMVLNNGFVISFLLIIVAMISDTNEYWAGFVLALAMMKPQMALLFYITLFFKKKYKTIVVSGSLLVASWLIYILMVGGNPLLQVKEILGQSEEKSAEFIWFGIMDWMTKLGVSGTVTMCCSMLVGILFTIVITFLIMKSKYKNNLFVLFSIPAFFSTIWCYKSETDLMILILPSIIIMLLCADRNAKWIQLFGVMYLSIFNVKIFTGGIRRLVGYDWIMGRNIDAWVRLIFFVAVIYVMVTGNCNAYKESDGQGA